MAADVKTKNIFTKSDGSPLIFFMRPCAERQSIKPFINVKSYAASSIFFSSFGEKLLTEPDMEGKRYGDCHAVKLKKESKTVGHVPKEISRIVKFFIIHGGKVFCTVTGNKQRSKLAKGGLEIPCQYSFETENKKMIETLEEKLKEIDEHGGKVTSNAVPGCIKLAEKGSTVTEDGYISSRFLKACVNQNKMLDVNDFRIKPGTTAPGDSSDEESESDYSLSPADEIKQRPVAQIKGRNKYTKEEDIAIMRHLITENMYSDAQGMKVWKQMEFLKVTNHSAQSMNTRYRKNILPNIQQYIKDIDRSWISKLTGVIISPTDTSFNVDDMFKRKSPRISDIKEQSSKETSNHPASCKPGKKLYQQLEFVELDKNKTKKISQYFPTQSENANIAKERNADNECNATDLHLGPAENLVSSHRGTEKSLTKKLTPGSKTQSGTVTNFRRVEKVRNDSDIAKSVNDTDKSLTRNISLRDRTCDRNVINTRYGMKNRNDHDEAKTGNDSGSECNIVSSSIELTETSVQLSETEDQLISESERQKSADYHKFINLKRKNNDDHKLSNLKRRTLRSNAIEQLNDKVLAEENKKRKKSDAIISNSFEDEIGYQGNVKRLHLDEELHSSEVQNNESLEVNTHTIFVNSQDNMPDTDVVHDTPGDDDRTGNEIINTNNAKRNTGMSHILNKNKPGSKTSESSVGAEKRTSTKQLQNQESMDGTSVDEIINSIDDILDSQKETRNVGLTPDSVKMGDETMEPEDGVGCSQGLSLLKRGPQTSTPKANPKDDDGLIELDVDNIEDCRAICKSIAERYDLEYETVRLLLYGCNGNIKRALSYINFGSHSFYPLPWSVRDDGLLEDHRNVPSLIVKYGAKEVQERLLFLEELL